MKMNEINSKQVLYLLLSLATLLAGYAFLRYSYRVTDSMPFTQEIVLIILGTVATIFITALLLNKQTSVEIEKEQSIKFLDLKTHTYERLFDVLEEMSSVDNFKNSSLVTLQFITHRLAIIASADVIYEYHEFLKVIKKASADNSFSGDNALLHKAIGSLTVEIRKDLTNGIDESEKYTILQVSEMIEKNSDQSAKFIKNG